MVKTFKLKSQLKSSKLVSYIYLVIVIICGIHIETYPVVYILYTTYIGQIVHILSKL